jgi:hypothetical protein
VEIKITKEDLSHWEVGDAYREATVEITIDSTASPRLQRQAVIYEVLSALLDPLECSHDLITEVTIKLGDALDQLEIDLT